MRNYAHRKVGLDENGEVEIADDFDDEGHGVGAGAVKEKAKVRRIPV